MLGDARRIQAKALLLLAVFLSAGTGLPSPDGLLFHQDGDESRPPRTHVEPAGGCLEHAEHCVLGRTASGAGAVATPVTEVRIELSSRSALQPFPTQHGRSYQRGLIPQPRAPPGLRAV